MPAGDPHHAGDPGGLVGDRRAAGLTIPQPDDRSSGGGPGFARLIVRTDGAARGNPGSAAAGAVLIDAGRPGSQRPDAPPLASLSAYLGVATNNVAEWTAVVRALDLAAELGAREVDLLLDSQLIVEQLNGRWRVRDAKLIPLSAAAMGRLRGFERWRAIHVRRAENFAADRLCNEAIDRVHAGGPAEVVRQPMP